MSHYYLCIILLLYSCIRTKVRGQQEAVAFRTEERSDCLATVHSTMYVNIILVVLSKQRPLFSTVAVTPHESQ